MFVAVVAVVAVVAAVVATESGTGVEFFSIVGLPRISHWWAVSSQIRGRNPRRSTLPERASETDHCPNHGIVATSAAGERHRPVVTSVERNVPRVVDCHRQQPGRQYLHSSRARRRSVLLFFCLGGGED